jgi:ribonuclease Z
MDLSLFFAGTAGSVPSARRGLPAVLLRRGGDRILFDCGEGTQRQLVRSVGLADVDAVFLTHLHTDHWLGLPGMLRTFDLRDRERDLTVYGPPGLLTLMKAMSPIYGRTAYRLEMCELEPYEEVEFDGYRVGSVPVRHRGVAYGYSIAEDARPGRFDAELAASFGVRPGPDFGRLQRGETVDGVSPEQIVGPDREGRKLVISGDTTPCDALLAAAHRADLLVHEATFADEELGRAQLTRHSTARQAATLAAEAEVELLALVHVSGRYAGREIRDEAREVFARSLVPRDFDTIEVPYPEKGAPELVHWEPPTRGAPPAAAPER